jgi:YVTN family beta-propeller protein
MRLKAALGLALALALLPSAAAAAAPPTHDVLVVGNNWEGTADVVDPRTFQRLTRLNIIPDEEERTAEIMADPQAAGYFTGINLLIGEGNNQYVDDAFTSHDGRYLYVSRPSFKDVVAFDLSTRKIVWRFQVEGYRADHMAISPDGRRLLVSASTANKVHVIDTATGKAAGEFPSGDSPHENNYSLDGTRIFHASIGLVYTPADDPAADSSKGERYFQVVDAKTNNILKRVVMGEKLEEAGYPNMSSAVRPMALAPDERRVYLQISFFHGFVEYDLERHKVLRVVELPISNEAKGLRREQYLLDSAHHGIAMNPEGTKLCVAGTMSDYAAVVSRPGFAHRIAVNGEKPYWVTNSGDGRYCFVSFSGDDRVSVVSYAQEKEIASIPVGDHPQRMRMGRVRCDYLGPAVDCVPPRISRLKVVRGKGGRRRFRARISEPALLRVSVLKARPGRWVRTRIVRRRGRTGTNRFTIGRLPRAGRYHLRVRATDAAGNNSRTKRVRFRIASR